jgi:hypothetical protein
MSPHDRSNRRSWATLQPIYRRSSGLRASGPAQPQFEQACAPMPDREFEMEELRQADRHNDRVIG